MQRVDPKLARSWSLAVPDEEAVRAALPDRALLVELLVAGEEMLLFATDREELRTFTVPVGRKGRRVKRAGNVSGGTERGV